MIAALDPIDLRLDAQDPDAFAATLGASFREIGFAVIAHHVIDQAVIDNALDAAKAFFALPETTKRGYFDPAGGGQRGYTPFGTESAKGETAIDQKEFWHLGRDLPGDHRHASLMKPTPSVTEVAAFDTASRALFNALDQLGQQLLRAIARHMSLPEDWFAHRTRDGNSILRLLHYPPQLTPPPEGSVRAAAHEDINVITLLLGAEEAGLEVFHRGMNQWIPVKAPAGTMVINVGDMLQRMTNNILPSTSHRVVNPAPDRSRHARFSTPFFLHFEPDVVIDSLPQAIAEQGTNHYPDPITAQAYLEERLREIGLI